MLEFCKLQYFLKKIFCIICTHYNCERLRRRKDVDVASGEPIVGGGLGLLASNNVQPNSVLLQVPTHLTFTTSTSKLEKNQIVEDLFQDPKVYINAPWWAKLSIDLIVCKHVNSNKESPDGDKVDMTPWIESLPSTFYTPIRWNEAQLDALQYTPLTSMVKAQENLTKNVFDQLSNAVSPSSALSKALTYDAFLWGCDCARSRAFSGAYGGSAFDPKPYAFTLLLVAAYVGAGLGTLEQASNGAGLVLCGSILKDFVFPKLFQSKKYIICPFIDMANHKGVDEDANVSFEYFADGFSVSTRSDVNLEKKQEVFITYGPRSNDALLQYYGFVEPGNAHDVYIMPPLREWDIDALEKACGRTFQPGRLQKLENAGLLGGTSLGKDDDDDNIEEGVANRGRGVVVTRAGGIDPAIITALRALISTAEEWEAAGEAVGNFVTENSGGKENERIARLVAQKAIELELESKGTTLEEDECTWSKRNILGLSEEECLALAFRIEKKKLLKETAFALSLK